MLNITSDCYSVEMQLAKSDSLSSISSLLSTVAILLAPGRGRTSSQAKFLLDSDGGSHTYPVGGLHEQEGDYFSDDPVCGLITAWELLPNGQISVMTAEHSAGFDWPMVPEQLDLTSSLDYLDKLHAALRLNSASASDQQMIQRGAILELRNRLDSQENISSPSDLKGDLPAWWPEVVAHGRAQGVVSSPQAPKKRGFVMLFEDVN